MGTLRFRGKIDNECVSVIRFVYSSIVVHMVIVSNDHLVHSSCNLHLGSKFL